MVRGQGIGRPGRREDVWNLLKGQDFFLPGRRRLGRIKSPGGKGPCRPLEGEERTEVPSEANTVDADPVPEKAKSYAPMRRGPLTSAFSGRGDNIGMKQK